MRVSMPLGVQVTHMPSGLVARCHLCRSTHRNKEIAVSMIEAALTHPQWK